MKTIVVIIPTYNESLVIEETIHQVFKATSFAAFETHILVIDSASKDLTQEYVEQLKKTYPCLHLITEPQKTGLGSAYMQGMRYALDHLKADIIVEFDADLSHQPQYLAPMIEALRDCDVVVGSRYIRGGSIPADWGWHRKWLSRLGNTVARLILTPKYKDFTSGFRATHRCVLQKALPSTFISNNYAYKLELFWNLHKARAKIVEYPIAFLDRTRGESKLPANSIFDSLHVLILLRLRALKSYMSMCAVGLIGLTLQCLVYNALRSFCTPSVAVLIAVLVAILNNFILNNHLTFKNKKLELRFKSIAFFVGYSVLMSGFQSNWMQLGIYYWGPGLFNENLIMFSGIVLGSVLNYFFYSRMIWREPLLE